MIDRGLLCAGEVEQVHAEEGDGETREDGYGVSGVGSVESLEEDDRGN